jgi:hypothetical protein
VTEAEVAAPAVAVAAGTAGPAGSDGGNPP